ILIKAARRHIYSQPVPIPAVYAANARPSHFRGVRDITFITIMVAKNLARRGFFLPGLYRSAIKPRLPRLADKSTDNDGLVMLLASTLLMVLTAGTSLLAALLYVTLQALVAPKHVRNSRLLLVFGKQLRNDQPDSEYQARLHRAARLLHDQPERRVLLLGGYTANASISESAAGREYLRQQGIGAERIDTEDDSQNTLENLKEARTRFDKERLEVTLISNRYHLARVCVMARGFGLRVHPCAAETRLQPRPQLLVKLLIEAFYLHWYLTGKYWARLTHNTRMLDRIS
ncbi:MAG: YdcF family protein, partial [Gammaproteobacteria bacterium]